MQLHAAHQELQNEYKKVLFERFYQVLQRIKTLEVWDDYIFTKFYMEKSCEKRGSNFCYPRDENHRSYSGKSMIDRDKQFLAKQTSRSFLNRIKSWGRSKYYNCLKIELRFHKLAIMLSAWRKDKPCNLVCRLNWAQDT